MDLTRTRQQGVIRNVQALRAVAVLVTVIFHLPAVLTLLGWRLFGYGGVDIFFVISGFIMVYTTAGRPVTPWTFMVGRIRRIVPLYWMITLAVMVVGIAAPSLLQATQASGLDLAKSLAFIPYAKPNGEIQPMLFVGWSLNYEMFFYLMFAAGLALPHKRLGVLAVTVVLVGLVGAGLLTHPVSVIGRFYTSPVMIEFALGMAIGLGAPYLAERASVAFKALAGLGVVGGVLAALTLPVLFPDHTSLLLCGLPATVAVGSAVALERWGWSIRSRFVLLLGNISYSIYLTHPFVTRAVERLSTRVAPGWPSGLALLLLAFAGTVAVGLVAHHTLERPMRWRQRRGRALPA